MDKRKIIPPFLLLITLIMTMSCTRNTLPNPNPGDSIPLQPMPEDAGQVIDAQNDFAFKLYKLLDKDNESGNTLISPLSIFMDLSMVYNGADGTTKTGMQEALQLNQVNDALLNETNAALIHNLPAIDPDLTLAIANSIWYKDEFTPIDTFLKIGEKSYDAAIKASDFSDQATVEKINSWVDEKTNGKISNIIDQIDPQEVMFLLNAVYFKADWTFPFPKEDTEDREFHLKGNTTVSTPFMHADLKSVGYFEDDTWQAVALPYGKDEKFVMYVLLPKATESSALTPSLEKADYGKIISQMKAKKVNLYLPKWESLLKIDNLREQLTALGMGEAFTDQADFGNMFEDVESNISFVKHVTYIKVDEEGTEAAAVTGTGMVTTSVGIDDPVTMQVDHPFRYFISEKETGNILFMGEVGDPSVKE